MKNVRKRSTKRLQTVIKGESRTKQQFKLECDINTIMKKYEKTGLITHVKEGGTYGDFTNVSDYHSALNQVIEADEAFMTLPASTRKKFNNDAAQMIAFLDDPKNDEEAIKLGLKAKPIQDPVLPQEPVKTDSPAPEAQPKSN